MADAAENTGGGDRFPTPLNDLMSTYCRVVILGASEENADED